MIVVFKIIDGTRTIIHKTNNIDFIWNPSLGMKVLSYTTRYDGEDLNITVIPFQLVSITDERYE